MRRLTTLLATPVGRIARYLISLTLLGWLAAKIDWSQLAASRPQLSLTLAFVSLLIAGLTYPLHAWRWWLLFRAQGLPLSIHWAHGVTWIGQFYNAFLLGGLGGDAARAFYLVRDAPRQRAGGLFSLMLDRAMGLAVLILLAALALAARSSALLAEPSFRWIIWAGLTISGAAIFAGFIILRFPLSRWPASLRRYLSPDQAAALEHLLTCLRTSPRTQFEALAVSGLIWALDFIAIWILAQAVALPLPFFEVCIAVSAAYAATVLPISVGGHGIREGTLLATLTAFGLLNAAGAHERALLLAFLVWFTTVFWSLIGGLVILAAPRLLPPPPNSKPS